ncbi:hypothetical protein [Actinoplanes teichomyceticus]|uniref:Uncharacterized protein n=1 Tax=Actinoplanes teichomyceticus TaxID=1867 RepID=A0A561WAG6_ACTTI|nr:hypothetical protein [Actinoplanes teichomyceticus]TWG20852.1 hypothetical protein FHX34_103381 [Actinoplanes teichomyceticus]GIF14513.1 hypothetical protein Ate01nite_45450 [Actinoplanes teichomyceticus]
MRVLTGLVLLVSSAAFTVPALLGMTTLLSAPSLLSAPALFAAFVLVVSSASIAVFAQLAMLALTRRRPVRPDPPAPAGAPLAGHSEPLPPGPAALQRRTLRTVPFLMAALALLPGCASAPAAQAASPAACGPAARDQVRADAALREGRAQPAPRRVSVPLGSQVRLGISADTAADIHVHGYDLRYPVQPGQPACVVFVASRPGLFDVEAHPDILLLQLEVK